MGGGALLHRDSRIEDFMLGLARSDRPRVCFLPTAGGEKPEWIVRFYEELTAHDCEPSHLTLFGMPAVLGGMSAGANCWFEDSVTDSFGPTLRALGGGLGLLEGSFCPHYDGEPERRPTYTRLVADGVLPPGYAADDDAALHFEGAKLREVVSKREGARGYRVTVEGEEPLDTRVL